MIWYHSKQFLNLPILALKDRNLCTHFFYIIKKQMVHSFFHWKKCLSWIFFNFYFLSSFRIPYHYMFSMSVFKEWPIHLHSKWSKWLVILKLSFFVLFFLFFLRPMVSHAGTQMTLYPIHRQTIFPMQWNVQIVTYPNKAPVSD